MKAVDTGFPTSRYEAGLRNPESFNSVLESHFVLSVAIFLLLCLACTTLKDVHMKMWNDEIRTLYVARQGSPVEIVRSTLEGMDATPPLYPILVSALLPFVTPDALAVRLPSTLGFVGMLLFVLMFCRRRMPAIYAYLAAILLATVCAFYATEGRCYGLVLGCAACALFCWQAATERRPRVSWLVLLAVCLSLATALHYYSVFLVVPLGLAEVARWRVSKKPDIAVMAAMFSPLPVLLICYPLIAVSRRYLPHFWGPGIASWSQIPKFYFESASIPTAILLLGLFFLYLKPVPIEQQTSGCVVLPVQEWLAVGGLALTPIVVLVVSKLTIHVFLSRYVVWASIGIAIVSASVLCSKAGKQPAAGVAVCAIALLSFGSYELYFVFQTPTLRQGETVRRELQLVPSGAEPVVIGYSHAYMELSYYERPEIRHRLYYLLSRNLELQYEGSDLDYFLMAPLRKRAGLHVVDLDEFLHSNPRFFLLADEGTYWASYLDNAGYCLRPLNPEAAPASYEVESPESGSCRHG